MIKHIVFFKLKDNTADRSLKLENLKKLTKMLENLKSVITQIKEFEVGVNISTREVASDLALYSVFDSQEDLEVYQKHHEHQKVVEFIKSTCSEIRVVDYEFA